jgi:sucrose-phosphate synthase
MLALITDIDGTVSGDAEGLAEFKKYIKKIRDKIFFVYATGRNMNDYKNIEKRDNLPYPDALILNTGADIYLYKNGVCKHNKLWNKIIDSPGWTNKKISELLKKIEELTPQDNIQKYKVSFYIKEGKEKLAREKAKKILMHNKIDANVIISHGIYLDVLPKNCDKGKAALFLIQKKGINKKDVIVAGDSENDMDLFFTFDKGIVVANALENVKKELQNKNFYFAKNSYAKGLVEGLDFYFKNFERER